jgi:hypothetical protein
MHFESNSIVVIGFYIECILQSEKNMNYNNNIREILEIVSFEVTLARAQSESSHFSTNPT